jgi:hypothetical protein
MSYPSIASKLEGIVLQLADGSIQACNSNTELILGLKAEQMQGWTSVDPRWQVIHEDGSPFPGETHPAIQLSGKYGSFCKAIALSFFA